MQRAPPSRVKRPKSYATSAASSSKPRVQGSFYQAHNFTVRDSNFYDSSRHLEISMRELADKTIPGATFDSSERDPPPRCHPGTRLAIVERTHRFFANLESNTRLLWLVGPAGVGKSAIMQTLAETSPTPDFTLGASLFFSVNGRDNGLQTIVTLAYQLAVKSKLYKDFVQNELTNDPTLLDKALAPQFKKFIVEPFVTLGISPEEHERFLILIDGLDECNGQDTQRTILELISSFCIEYPAAPLVWVIASRPEPHITRFLSRPDVIPSYTTEQVEINDDESRKDVERYLRHGLENIRTKYPALDHFPYWPAEHDFLKLATAAGGLFAFGKTVVDYIDDPIYANPASQLDEVLEVIDEIQSRQEEGKRHPMAGLDLLYSRIISKIPRGILSDTKRLLLYVISPPSDGLTESNFRLCCNWLAVPTAAAYGALHHLHSVLNIPAVPDAPFKALEFRHKSFRDYLSDFERSRMFPNLDNEARELHTPCATRILDEVSEARNNGHDPFDGISLSWPSPIEEPDRDRGHKMIQYTVALQSISKELTFRRPPYGPGVLSALGLIDIQLGYSSGFDWDQFAELASGILGKDIRPELTRSNAIHKMPIGILKTDETQNWMAVIMSCHFEHRSLAPARPRCSFGSSHQFRDKRSTEDSDHDYSWTKECRPGGKCRCAADVLQKLEDRKTVSPGDVVTTFTDVTGNYGWVHHAFPDSKYPSSTWEFIIPYHFEPTVAIVEPI